MKDGGILLTSQMLWEQKQNKDLSTILSYIFLFKYNMKKNKIKLLSRNRTDGNIFHQDNYFTVKLTKIKCWDIEKTSESK